MATEDQDTVVLRDATLLKDRYLLVRQLGEGGFGSVHLAHDLAMHERPVVVKIQHHQSMDDPWFERKFSEEVRALSLIDHPGVISAIDSGRTPDGKPFLVMQYVDGVTLRDVMTPTGMPHARAAEILKQMGHALAAAHEKGIWHRDLKPENLMLQKMTGGGERVRLIDFGIATVTDLGADPTKTRVAGSIAYMAPEQRMGQPSSAADIYAMGLIAYELLTGTKPSPDADMTHLPPQTGRLIARSLSREPGERPVDARELGDQLYRSLIDSDVTRLTVPPPETKRTGNRLRLAAIVMAGLFAIAYFKGPKPAKAPRVEPPAPTAVPDQAVELAFWNSVKDSTEPQMYREYLAKYPEGQFAGLAEAKLALLTKPSTPSAPVPVAVPAVDPADEKNAWNDAKSSNDAESYQGYLNKFPRGKHEIDARKKLAAIKKRESKDGYSGNSVMQELTYWKSIQSRDNPDGYREYLAKYPNGLFAVLARRKLDGSH